MIINNYKIINKTKLQLVFLIAVLFFSKNVFADHFFQLNAISLGAQFQAKKIKNANYEYFENYTFPTFASSFEFNKSINKKSYWGLNIGFESGSINRIFNFTNVDSNGSFEYKSNFKINFISYGIGAFYKQKIKTNFTTLIGLNYMILSTQGYGGKEYYNNNTSKDILFYREDRFNNFNNNKNFLQLVIGIEKSISKNKRHSINLKYTNSLNSPIIGGITFKLENTIIENTAFHKNFSNVRFGYSYLFNNQ